MINIVTQTRDQQHKDLEVGKIIQGVRLLQQGVREMSNCPRVCPIVVGHVSVASSCRQDEPDKRRFSNLPSFNNSKVVKHTQNNLKEILFKRDFLVIVERKQY